MTVAAVAGSAGTSPALASNGGSAALPERRFAAFLVDVAVEAVVYAAALLPAYLLLLRVGRVWLGLGVLGAAVIAHAVGRAVLVGRRGVSPGKALLGLRVLDDSVGSIGLARGARRTVVVLLAGWPTLGLGAAFLAWTVLAVPGQRRRGWHDLLVGSTVLDTRARSESAPEEAPPAAPSLVNLTTMRLARATPPARRRTPTGSHGWRVAFDSGERFVVHGLTLVGRGPVAAPGEPVHRLVALPSADLSLSGTHARFQVTPDGALVLLDSGSRNGSVVCRRGLDLPVVPGRPTTLVEGDAVRFGDRTMTVSRSGP